MNLLESSFTSGVQEPASARSSSASHLTLRPLAPARASTVAPGLRELRVWELPPGAVGRCQLEAGDRVTLTGIRGQCWVTQQGDRHDYLLIPGETRIFQGPGRLVFEAVADAAALAVS